MKKLTLSIGLVAAILSAKAQDTTCTYFKGKNVYEFDYKMDTILNTTKQTARFYTIEVSNKQVLCLDLGDSNKIRKVITIYPDGTETIEVLKCDTYYSDFGPFKVQVGKPKRVIAGKY